MPDLTQKDKFIIYCTPRSGSYLLVDLINNIPSVKCYGELFKPHGYDLGPGFLKSHNLNYSCAKRDKQPFKFLEDLYNVTQEKKIGFKIFPSHHKWVFNNYLKNVKVKKIILYRPVIDVYISLQNAKHSNVWITKNNSSDNRKTFTLDLDHFERYNHRHTKYYTHLKDKLSIEDQKYLWIAYKDLIKKGPVMESLSTFIDPSSTNINWKSDLKKQVKSYKKLLQNYDESIEFFNKNYTDEFAESALGIEYAQK